MRAKTKQRRSYRVWLPSVIAVTLIALLALVILSLAMRHSLGLAQSRQQAEDLPEPVTEQTVYDLESYAAAHGYDLADYPAALVELYEKNPDARQFVLEYPLKKDETPEIDLSQEIESGAVPCLYQWDERWGYCTYNENFMARTGCGPTCLSMAVIALTGDAAKDPWTLAQYAQEHHYNVPGSGTSWSFIPEGAAAFGLHAQALGLSESAVYEELAAGHLVICVVGPGDFTDNGHFLLLTGTENGMLRLHDPNSASNTSQLWTYERIASQIQGIWTLWK